jgi:diamine N-acetyltransferase
MNITFRQATVQDIQLLKEINLTSFEANAEFDKYIDMDWVNTEHATKYFTNVVANVDDYVVFAEVEGKPVGYVIVEPKILNYRKAKIAEIGIIAVLPEFRSSGIGESLVNKAKEWAKAYGYHTLFVNSYIGNVRAIQFYKKQGFAPIDMSLEMDV